MDASKHLLSLLFTHDLKTHDNQGVKFTLEAHSLAVRVLDS